MEEILEISSLKTVKSPVSFDVNKLSKIDNVQLSSKDAITIDVIEETKESFKMMVLLINKAFEEEPLVNRPCMLDGFPKKETEINFIEGNTLIPGIIFTQLNVELNMGLVPVFMEWSYNGDFTCRVLAAQDGLQFYILHMDYTEAQEFAYPAGDCVIEGLFTFSLTDLMTVSRMKTIRAAFTNIDNENITGIHDNFIPYSLVH